MIKAQILFLLDFGEGAILKRNDEILILKEVPREGLDPVYLAESPLYPGRTFTLLERDFRKLRPWGEGD